MFSRFFSCLELRYFGAQMDGKTVQLGNVG